MEERLIKAPCGFVSINHDGFITEVNDTFLDWMGYEQQHLVGQHFEWLLTMPNKLIFHSYFYPSINLEDQVDELYIHFRDVNGNSIPYLMNARRFILDGVEVIDCILVQMKNRINYEMELRSAKRQIEQAYLEKNQTLAKLEQIYQEIEKNQTELMAINSSLIEMSNTDTLTGINNRRYFQEKLEEQMALFKNEGKPFSLMIIDIDHFKKVNDTYGHQMGDFVLVKLATILQNHARPEDVVARFGGEEFTVILPNTDAKEALAISQNLNQAVEREAWEGSGTLTVSVGVATFNEEDTAATIIKNADDALYASKENGRNRATHYYQLK
ncbi:sensor domain-containing diguanylate cyclase [Lysinibacillus sp. 54212]|uniref:sensor domain-containing diguanylate cyclase n=1 Tax=Lysinibacillus sp. 54212 TaxID=3119829 RepID=UPI002FC6C41A